MRLSGPGAVPGLGYTLAGTEVPAALRREGEPFMRLKKVLIVDDSELVHKMHGLVLQRYQKCEILHTYDGNQALEALNRNPDVQLILLDINMPVMDGLRFLEVRKQTGLFTDIPVVI